jgi:hypothetical protein
LGDGCTVILYPAAPGMTGHLRFEGVNPDEFHRKWDTLRVISSAHVVLNFDEWLSSLDDSAFVAGISARLVTETELALQHGIVHAAARIVPARVIAEEVADYAEEIASLHATGRRWRLFLCASRAVFWVAANTIRHHLGSLGKRQAR